MIFYQPRRICLRKLFFKILCLVCTREEESIIHALRSCPVASGVWGYETSPMSKWSNTAPSFWHLWKQMVDKLKTQELWMSATILKQIWTRRNLVVFEEKFKSPISVAQKAKLMLETFQNAHLPASTSTGLHLGNQRSPNRAWKPPAINQLKFNWNTSLNYRLNTIGLGMILKDFKGDILASACCNKPNQYRPVIVEALALRKAVLISQDLGLTQVIFEGDCKIVINAATSRETINSKLYSLIHDIQSLLSHQLTWKIQLDYKETNKVAHNLAILACIM